MASKYDELESRAKARGNSNWKFRRYLKEQDVMSDDQLDQLVRETTDRVWQGIDCTQCARCCRELQPELSDDDQQRLARRLGISVEKLREQYLFLDKDDMPAAWRIRELPCPFLEGNRCGVYDDRPANCRDYPYLYKPEFSFRTQAMIKRTFTCPIVFEVIEQLKDEMYSRERELDWEN